MYLSSPECPSRPASRRGAVGDGLFDHLTGAAIEPDVVGEIRCAEGDAALASGPWQAAHGKRFTFLGFHQINLATGGSAHREATPSPRPDPGSRPRRP